MRSRRGLVAALAVLGLVLLALTFSALLVKCEPDKPDKPDTTVTRTVEVTKDHTIETTTPGKTVETTVEKTVPGGVTVLPPTGGGE